MVSTLWGLAVDNLSIWEVCNVTRGEDVAMWPLPGPCVNRVHLGQFHQLSAIPRCERLAQGHVGRKFVLFEAIP